MVSPHKQMTIPEVEKRILDDCSLIDLNLPMIEMNMGLPRFSLPLSKINYAALISKAYFLYKKHEKE